MRPGQRTSSAPGDVQDMILRIDSVVRTAAGVSAAKWYPTPNYGRRYWGVYFNGIKQAHVPTLEGTPGMVAVPMVDFEDSVGVHIEDMGDWADPSYDFDANALDAEAQSARQFSAQWEGKPAAEERIDTANQLTGWSFTGLKRFTNCERVENRPTWALLQITLSNSGTTRTVNVYASGRLVASGFRVGDGSISLTQQNSSGVSGTVDVTYSAPIALGEFPLTMRWPKQYQLHYSTSALSYPRTPEKVILDNGSANVFGYTTAQLASGTYNVAIVPVTDTGIECAAVSLGTAVIAGTPNAPLGVQYAGGGSTAPQIKFTSASASDTFKIYASATLDGPINMSTPAATETAAVGVHTVTLSSYGIGVTGTIYVLVRAVTSGGVEERNGQVISIKFTTGTRVVPAPNSPRIREVSASGRTVTVIAAYDGRDSQSLAVKVQLFAWAYALGAGGASYGSPVDTENLPVLSQGVGEVTLSYLLPADGHYYLGVKAITIGGIQDAGTDAEVMYVSTALDNTVINGSLRVSRG